MGLPSFVWYPAHVTMPMPADADMRVCAVCARVLSRLTDRDTGEQTYVHPADMQLNGTDDHPPVPVKSNEVVVDTRCDFCFAPQPGWIVPVKNFAYDNLRGLGMPVDHGSMGSWAACDTCAELLNRGLWSDLTRRAISAFQSRRSELMGDQTTDENEIAASEFAAEQLRVMYRQLRKNVVGAPRRHPNG